MTDIKINYETEVFIINISEENNFYNIISSATINFLNLNSVVKDIKDKKFEVFRLDIIEPEIFTFSQLKKIIENSGEETVTNLSENTSIRKSQPIDKIKVLNPTNVQEIKNITSLDLLVKDFLDIKQELIQIFINEFDFTKEYENYEEFVNFFIESLQNGIKIIENEEFPGRLFKFYKDNSLIKVIYIHDDKISFLDSFAQKYKELQLDKIKEALNNLNEELKLEGKEQFKLEFKDE